MRFTLARVLAAVVLGVSSVGCSKNLDTVPLESQLRDQLATELGAEGITVDCPDDVEVETGRSFTCAASDESGSVVTIEVTQTDTRGNVTWKIVDAET